MNFEGETIESSDLAKLLGIHVDFVIEKWQVTLKSLRKPKFSLFTRVLRKIVDFKMQTMIYFMLYYVCFYYAIWG